MLDFFVYLTGIILLQVVYQRRVIYHLGNCLVGWQRRVILEEVEASFDLPKEKGRHERQGYSITKRLHRRLVSRLEEWQPDQTQKGLLVIGNQVTEATKTKHPVMCTCSNVFPVKSLLPYSVLHKFKMGNIGSYASAPTPSLPVSESLSVVSGFFPTFISSKKRSCTKAFPPFPREIVFPLAKFLDSLSLSHSPK